MRTKCSAGVLSLAITLVATFAAMLAGSIPAAVAQEQELTEQAISDKVNDELMIDRGVAFYKIDVDTNDGVVTLSGSVNNILAKERAAAIARTVRGVRSVVNRIEVTPTELRSDDDIQRDVEAALLNDPATDSYEVTTSVEDGTVTLQGTVESYDVINGTAHLYGTVDSRFEKNRADDLASRVIGVIEVENHLDVEEQRAYLYDPYVDEGFVDESEVTSYDRRVPYMTDQQIKESIRSELWWTTKWLSRTTSRRSQSPRRRETRLGERDPSLRVSL